MLLYKIVYTYIKIVYFLEIYLYREEQFKTAQS